MTYTLKYLEIKGLGEAVRLIFAAAGVDFTDERVTQEQWPAIKAGGRTLGQLPILEIDGGKETMAQSTSICRYLARKYGLTGQNEWEAAKCDEYVDAVVDLFVDFVKFFFEKDPEKKAQAMDNFVKVPLPKYPGKLNMIKSENGGNYMVGKDLTWCDIFITDRLERLEDFIGRQILDDYPHLRKLKDAVFGLEKIKLYLDKRPKTQM